MHCHLEILAESQQYLWNKFSEANFKDFVLYGGTALALRLGHRRSIDFDFFSSASVTQEKIHSSWSFMDQANLRIIQQELNTYTVLVQDTNMSTTVKLSFFGGIKFGQIQFPDQAANRIKIASLHDLFATKLTALFNRIEAKDYIDIAALLSHGILLEDGIGALKAIHPQTNPATIARTLCYFEGGDLSNLSHECRQIIEASVANLGTIPDTPIINPTIP